MAPSPSLAKLVGIAGACGVGVGIMATLVFKERDRLTNQAAFIKGAVQLLKEQSVTRDLLGDDIKIGKATLSDGWSRVSSSEVQVRVPIIGERDKATLFVYARRKTEEDKFRLYKLEATFEAIRDKKLILMDRTNDDVTGEVDVIKAAIERADAVQEELRRREKEEKAAPDLTKMSPWQKRNLFVEQMKSWQPPR